MLSFVCFKFYLSLLFFLWMYIISFDSSAMLFWWMDLPVFWYNSNCLFWRLLISCYLVVSFWMFKILSFSFVFVWMIFIATSGSESIFSFSSFFKSSFCFISSILSIFSISFSNVYNYFFFVLCLKSFFYFEFETPSKSAFDDFLISSERKSLYTLR